MIKKKKNLFGSYKNKNPKQTCNYKGYRNGRMLKTVESYTSYITGAWKLCPFA